MVRDGLIQSVQDGFTTAPVGARVIDLRDRFVLPGLIDSHVHLDSDRAGNEGFLAGFTDSVATCAATRPHGHARKDAGSRQSHRAQLGSADGVTLRPARCGSNRGWAGGTAHR
jgi:imidazolonepropionase-like amidohydrolase